MSNKPSPFTQDTRPARIQFQLDEWVAGRSHHNDVDGECCPDFSCCNSDSLADEDTRILFRNSGEHTRSMMLMGFLGDMLAYHGKRDKVHIAGQMENIA